ncbi:MAG: tetratricopeptide repeat protein [candidate division Zixibacteria bacterium]|nr:tetratricopeptide repeat protein [candidate division Zixibacteria bacterium]
MKDIRRTITKALLPLALASIMLAQGGCVYYNTFYNAEKAFKSAEKGRKAGGQPNMNEYQTAIAKSLKVLDNYPKSKYYDDALFVLAVSYYHTKQYDKAERRFRELLANYPESEYTREANVYLAQSKLQLREVEQAMAGFEEIFQSDYPRQYKAQAALELGGYHAREKRYDLSIGYYRSVRDSLGDQDQQRKAQMAMADDLYQNYQFADALSAYLQVLGLKPSKTDEYHALASAADCAYKVVRVADGLAYLKRLADNQLFYDSLGAIQLKMAEGHELEGEMTVAQGLYGDIAATSTKKAWVAQAYYRLGLIFQFDYDNLDDAKFYYDKAVEAGRYSGQQTDATNDALQRSADIGKIALYQRRKIIPTGKPGKAGKTGRVGKARGTAAPSTAVTSGTSDTTRIADTTQATRATDTARAGDAALATDTARLSNAIDSTLPPDTTKPAMTLLTPDTTGMPDTTRTIDTARLADTLRPADTTHTTDSTHTSFTAHLAGATDSTRPADTSRANDTTRVVDTSAITQAQIDDAATQQYALAELYWYQLDKPDSAISALQVVLDSMTTARNAPKAMLALSQMVREYREDTAAADSILHAIPARFPHSDYIPEILEFMGLRGTPADTGYAEVYIKRAEAFWSDEKNYDSARYWYQYVVDHFPESAHYDRARFALIWLTETFQSPGDSSVFLAYQAYADSFPQSPFAEDARRKLVTTAARAPLGPELPSDSGALAVVPQPDSTFAQTSDTTGASPAYINPEEQVWYRGNDTLVPLTDAPVSVDQRFEFPPEAYSIDKNDFLLFFQVLLDFDGKVKEFELKTPSGNTEIDRRAKEAMRTSTFNMMKIRAEWQGKWMVYKMLIEKPAHLR